VLEAAQRWRQKKKAIHGFVHVGLIVRPEPLEQLRLPLVFGSVVDDRIAYDGPACQEFGKLVARCLQDHDIRFEWDRDSGNLIWVLADETLVGLTPADEHRVYSDKEYEVLRHKPIPDNALDKHAGNPVRLLNVVKARRLKPAYPRLQGRMRLVRIGDKIKLGFVVRDAIAPAAREEFQELADQMQFENMWVEVTSVRGQYPQCQYCGELVSVPVFIDPAQLRIGSPVNFSPDNIYPAQSAPKRRARR
jgi:hypothetical protein